MVETDELTVQEKRLVECARLGSWWEPETENGEEPDMNPAKAENWSADRTLRAAVIRCLMTGETWPGEMGPWPVGCKGVMVKGAFVSGALDLEGVCVSRTLRLRSCAFDGRVSLMDAETKTVVLSGSFLPEGLDAQGAKIKGDLRLRDGFMVKGEVNLTRATIEGQLVCDGGCFQNPGGEAIDLTLASIGSGLFLWKLRREKDQRGLDGRLVLSQARCRTYTDDRESWPEQGKLVLDGFTYERFHDCATDWKTRRDWLQRQAAVHLDDSFHPQPWTQAVKVLREMGHDRDARELAMQREIAHAGSKGTRWPMRLWLWFLRLTIGSGYKPHLALFWSLGFVLFGWLVFAGAANLGFMVPRDGAVQSAMAAAHGPLLQHYPRFNAPVYALDNFLPVTELGQDAAWVPSDEQAGQRRITQDGMFAETARLLLGHDRTVTGKAAARPADTGGLAAPSVWLFRHGFHRFVYWAQELLGWVFISLLIAGMSGLVKRE